MNRFIPSILLVLLVFSCSLVPYSFAQSKWPGSKVDFSDAALFDITDYGAIVGDGLSDDVAFQAAHDAACDDGGGTIIFPDGVYHAGNTGNNQFYSGYWVTCSNITLRAENKHKAEIRHLHDDGGPVIAVCPAFTSASAHNCAGDSVNTGCVAEDDPYLCCTGSGTGTCDTEDTKIENFTLLDLFIHDDDPAAHCAGGTNYSAADGDCDGGSGSGEESHGVWVKNVEGVLIEGNKFESIGDEAIEIKSDYVVVTQNEIVDTPSIRGSGGAAISVNTGNYVNITENTIRDISTDPLGDGGSCVPHCENAGYAIHVETSDGQPNDQIAITNNDLVNIDSWAGIIINSNQEGNSNVLITDNVVGMASTDQFGCISTATYSPPGTVTQKRCSIALLGTAGSASTKLIRDGIIIGNNTLTGGVYAVSSTTDSATTADDRSLGSVAILGNTLTGQVGKGITGGANPLLINNNLIRGFNDESIYLLGMEHDNEDDAACVAEDDPWDCCDDVGEGTCVPTDHPDGTGNVSILGNTIIDSNRDSNDGAECVAEDEGPNGAFWDCCTGPGEADGCSELVVYGFFPSPDYCGADGELPGGITFNNNKISPYGSPNSTGSLVQLKPCTKWTAIGNHIDSNGAQTSGGDQLKDATIIQGNTLLNAGDLAIETDADHAVISGNYIENPEDTAISATGDYPTISGNKILNGRESSIDASGTSPICVGNSAITTSTDAGCGAANVPWACCTGDGTGDCDEQPDIECGDAAPGAGCTADGDASGLCDMNISCNSGGCI